MGKQIYNNLNAELSRGNISLNEIAENTGITRQAFNNKRNDTTKWKLNEMVKIQEYINSKLNTNYTLDYLFKRE